jgi:hypothetical protein
VWDREGKGRRHARLLRRAGQGAVRETGGGHARLVGCLHQGRQPKRRRRPR